MFSLSSYSPFPKFPTAAPATATLNLPALVGAEGWARLPEAVQHRFAAAHADACYEGTMALRCSRTGRVFAALASLVGGPLTSLNASAVPTTVRVSSNRCGGVVWERCFHPCNQAGTPLGDCTVRSTKELGSNGALMERTVGGLSMSLAVFEEGGSLVFLSHQYWWVLGGFHIRIPLLVAPGTCRVVHTDLGDGRFRFTLSMLHPLWGETFHQSGIFADPVDAATLESAL